MAAGSSTGRTWSWGRGARKIPDSPASPGQLRAPPQSVTAPHPTRPPYFPFPPPPGHREHSCCSVLPQTPNINNTKRCFYFDPITK